MTRAGDPAAAGRGGGARATERAEDSPAQARLRTELLGWGRPRPQLDTLPVTELRDRLERDLAALGDQLDAAAIATGRRQLVVTKTRLDRLSCDGWQLDPAPYEHTPANVRGTLAHKALERDLDRTTHGEPALPAGQVVSDAWHELAVRSPGDPASLSAWLNGCATPLATELRDEVADLLTSFRQVWPHVPAGAVEVRTETRLDVALAGGRVRLQGTLDLLLDSPRKDDRARAMVVDFKTGIPRSAHDRAEVRFYALLAALATGRPPFRWATFYVTEGRPEVEELHAATLDAVARRIVDAVRQAARLTAVRAGTSEPQLRGGQWCRNCRREPDCEEAAAAAAARRAELGEDVTGPL